MPKDLAVSAAASNLIVTYAIVCVPGVCLGMQCAVIEYARNVLHLEDANSTEGCPDTKHPVVRAFFSPNLFQNLI